MTERKVRLLHEAAQKAMEALADSLDTRMEWFGECLACGAESSGAAPAEKFPHRSDCELVAWGKLR